MRDEVYQREIKNVKVQCSQKKNERREIKQYIFPHRKGNLLMFELENNWLMLSSSLIEEVGFGFRTTITIPPYFDISSAFAEYVWRICLTLLSIALLFPSR